MRERTLELPRGLLDVGQRELIRLRARVRGPEDGDSFRHALASAAADAAGPGVAASAPVLERMKFAVFSLVAGTLVAVPARYALATPPGAAPAPVRPTVRDDQAASRDAERFRLGALGGVGFPAPLSLEALARIDRVVAIGAEYGALPATNVAGVRTTLTSVAADVRVFPLRGAFFVGAAVGHQNLDLSATMSLPMLGAMPESMAYDEWFVDPRIGLLWRWGFGLSIGMDVGVQLPISSSMSTTLPQEALARASTIPGAARAESAVRWLGAGALPTIDLLQLGLLF